MGLEIRIKNRVIDIGMGAAGVGMCSIVIVVGILGASIGGLIVLVWVIIGVVIIIGRGKEGVKISAVTIREGQSASGVGSSSERVDTVLDLCRHRQLSPASTMDALTRH
jgi:hypothetical protein